MENEKLKHARKGTGTSITKKTKEQVEKCNGESMGSMGKYGAVSLGAKVIIAICQQNYHSLPYSPQ